MMKWASNSRELNELIKKEETTLLSGKPAVEPTKSVETENIDQPKSTSSNAAMCLHCYLVHLYIILVL